MSKIILIGIITVFTTILHADVVTFQSRTFVVDIKRQLVSDKSTKVNMDVFTSGMANGVVEVYDANNKLVDFKIVQGDRSEIGVFSNVAGSVTRTYQDLTMDSPGVRSPHVSKKTTISLDLPSGGYFLITKKSDRALATNTAVILAELVSEMVSENLTKDVEYVQALANQIILNMPKLLIDDGIFGNGVDLDRVKDEVLELTLTVAQEVGLTIVANKMKNIVLARATGGISEIYNQAESFKRQTQIVGIGVDLGRNNSSQRSLLIPDELYSPPKLDLAALRYDYSDISSWQGVDYSNLLSTGDGSLLNSHENFLERYVTASSASNDLSDEIKHKAIEKHAAAAGLGQTSTPGIDNEAPSGGGGGVPESQVGTRDTP